MSLALAKPSAADPPRRSSLLSRNRIAAFVKDDITASALRTGLEDIAQTLELKRGDIDNATRLLENDTELHSVIADISGVADHVAALESLARVCPADVRVALVGDRSDLALYRTLIDMGVLEYLPKPLTRDAVLTVLRPKLIGDGAESNRGGHVVSICGAQGGAGATSIAVNLALQLAETTKAKVALLDLHLQGGETAVMLNVRPGPGLRIALEDPSRADELFLERAAIEVNERVRLIAADEALDAELRITETGTRHLLELLRKRFNFIVVDVPVPLNPAIQAVIALSRHIFVLLEAEVTGLRNARALRANVTAISGKNRVFTVLNRYNRPGGLLVELITKGLEASPDILIPDLGKGMTEAVNQGVPALARLPALRRSLAPMVREIAGIRTETPRSLFRWLFAR
ncbi:MAG TPA: AAA family ATPase [Acetobacteraceae bacterium]|nr:AAA family ATPase [Acetobacteraceae bacterium]